MNYMYFLKNACVPFKNLCLEIRLVISCVDNRWYPYDEPVSSKKATFNQQRKAKE